MIMSTIQWGSLNSGNWSVASNWRGGVLPTLKDLVEIDIPVPLITISAAALAQELVISAAATVDDAGSLTLGEPLVVSVGDFTLDTSGALQWASGNHWITVYGGGEFQALGVHTLNALTLNLGVGDSSSAKVAYGTLTLGSTATVDFNGSSIGAAPSVQSMIGGALTNTGVIFANEYASALVQATTFVNSGAIMDQSLSQFTLSAQTFTNSGVLTVDGAGGATISASTGIVNNSAIDDQISLTIDTPLFVDNGSVALSGAGTQLIVQSSASGSGISNGVGGIAISGTHDVLEFIGNQTFSQRWITDQGANASLEIAGGSTTAGELTIASGSALDINATGMNITGGATTLGANTLVNDGVIDDAVTGGTLSFAVADLINNGAVVVGSQDDVVVRSALSGTGAFLIGSAGTLEIGSSAAPGGSVVFLANSNGELKLDAAPSFAETIQGFNVKATIDLSDIVATSATWASNLLTITESGGATFALNVAGSYANSTFLTASDNAGGTLIHLVAPAG
jgi:filamentous hemagglutinin